MERETVTCIECLGTGAIECPSCEGEGIQVLVGTEYLSPGDAELADDGGKGE